MTGNKHHRQGFTMIEMLIVAASFSVVFLVATTVYSNSLRQQKKVQSSQRVTADARYLIETIAREIRTKTINYGWYSNRVCNGGSACNLQLAQPKLALAGTCYGAINNKFWAGNDCATLGNTATSADITPSDISIDDFHVYITPMTDPFAANSGSLPCDFADTNSTTFINTDCQTNLTDRWCCPKDASTCRPDFQGSSGTQTGSGICVNANIQPTVTMVLKSTANIGEKTQSTIQTSVVTRTYLR